MIPNAAGTDSDEHLDEIGAGDGEERNASLAGDRPGEQRLAGPGRPDQQRALGDLAAEALELGRVLEEVDDLGQILLGLVDAGDILESHLVLVLGQQPRLRLAEPHRAFGAPCIWRMMKIQAPIISTIGSTLCRMRPIRPGPGG